MDDLSLWEEATRAQGDPSLYRHDEVEMYVMRVFEKYPFIAASKSKREKRRAFNELWDASGGDTMAIAAGVNTALKLMVYSVPYTKACITGWIMRQKLPEAVKRCDIFTQPKIVKDTPEVRPKLPPKSVAIEIPKANPVPAAPKRSRSKRVIEDTEDVEWK